MRLFSREIDDLALDALKRRRDKLEESLAEDRTELENDTARRVEKGRNKHAVERFRIMCQLSIDKDVAELNAVNALIDNIEAENASTTPE